MLKTITKFAIFSLLVAVVFTHASPTVNASPKSGITVEPAFVVIQLTPNDSTKTSAINIKNENSYAVSLNLSLKEVDVSSGILAPTKEIDTNQDQTVVVDKNNFDLAAGASSTVTVTVVNTSSLPPGGTYRALVIKQFSKADASVAMQTAISASIFITKQQGAIRSLDLNDIIIKQTLWQEPSGVLLTFKNTGNTHVVPRGIVAVTNKDKSSFYKKGTINQESITVFPGKSMTISSQLTILQKSWLPSKQKVVVQYRFDGLDDVQTAEKTFVYIPWVYFVIPFAVAAAIVFIYRLYTGRRRKKLRDTPIDTKQAKTSKKISVRDYYDGEKITVHRK